MNRIALIDLEETVIPIWEDWEPLKSNCERIRERLIAFEPTSVETFSWAIWTDLDKQLFNKNRFAIENEIGWKFNVIRSIQDVMRDIRKCSNVHLFSQQDFFDCFGKKEMALLFLAMNGFWKDSHILLFDDTVVNSTTRIHDLNVIIETIKM